jgi:hypothetical protein
MGQWTVRQANMHYGDGFGWLLSLPIMEWPVCCDLQISQTML